MTRAEEAQLEALTKRREGLAQKRECEEEQAQEDEMRGQMQVCCAQGGLVFGVLLLGLRSRTVIICLVQAERRKRMARDRLQKQEIERNLVEQQAAIRLVREGRL